MRKDKLAEWVNIHKVAASRTCALWVSSAPKKRDGASLEGSAVRLEVCGDHSEGLVGCEVDAEEVEGSLDSELSLPAKTGSLETQGAERLCVARMMGDDLG